MDKEFDLSEVIRKLDEQVVKLKDTLTPEVKYDWQIQREKLDALEAECERYCDMMLAAQGRAAFLRQVLDKIANRRYFTAEGAACQQEAKDALKQVSAPSVEPSTDEQNTNKTENVNQHIDHAEIT